MRAFLLPCRASVLFPRWATCGERCSCAGSCGYSQASILTLDKKKEWNSGTRNQINIQTILSWKLNTLWDEGRCSTKRNGGGATLIITTRHSSNTVGVHSDRPFSVYSDILLYLLPSRGFWRYKPRYNTDVAATSLLKWPNVANEKDSIHWIRSNYYCKGVF